MVRGSAFFYILFQYHIQNINQIQTVSIVRQPTGFEESATVAKEGAKAAKAVREQIEKSTGKPAISSLNAKDLGQKSFEARVEDDE